MSDRNNNQWNDEDFNEFKKKVKKALLLLQ